MQQPVADQNQPWRIAETLNEQGAITHGGSGSGTIRRVSIPRLTDRPTPAEIVACTFFCPSITEVTAVDAFGDGQEIGENTPVFIGGIENVLPENLPESSGHFDIGPVRFSTNGSIHVTFTNETVFTPSSSEPVVVS
ncbi:MAG: hypothetical protein PHW95_03655 [Patescibacteria group bacterium]|nr:hypothetical protein [Patescibacteria group bacterium]